MVTKISYLYVEDDLFSREVMAMIMNIAMGVADLVLFEDSHDFMTRLKALPHRPSVILLDIHIKPYDGFALLEMIRGDASYRDAKIIALTASVMNEEIIRLRQVGFDGVIGKPISVSTYPDLMRRIVSGEVVWHIN